MWPYTVTQASLKCSHTGPLKAASACVFVCDYALCSAFALYWALSAVTFPSAVKIWIRCLPAGGWSTTTTRCACRNGLRKTWATSTFTADCRAARGEPSPASAARRRAAPSSQRRGKKKKKKWKEEEEEREGWRTGGATASRRREATLGAAASRKRGKSDVLFVHLCRVHV